MEPLLADDVAVVTGGSSGIGRAIALTFAREGADVVVADLQAEPREGGTPPHEAIADDPDVDATATFVECDVTDADQVEAAVAAADEFGGVTVMVNNAGIVVQKPLLEFTEADYERQMGVNAKGAFLGAQAAARRMVGDGADGRGEGDSDGGASDSDGNSGGGSIVNVSSTAGIQGSANIVPYSMSKGAVRLMTYAMAAELGPEGVRVNAVHPGPIETAMTTDDVPIVGTEQGEAMIQTIPSRRIGDPGDVADAALFLASDLADYVNGESLVVDGGMTSSG